MKRGAWRVRWQRGFVASMRGLLKNLFAGLGYRWSAALLGIVSVPALATFPSLYLALSLASGSPVRLVPGLVAATAVALPVALLGATARRLAGGRGHEGLLLPLMGLALGLVVLASALGTTLRGAVSWRGTRYALDDLRAGGVRAADWPPDRAPG